MNSKNIKKSLKNKIEDWLKNISSERIKEIIKENAIVTGGAIVSLLNGEKPNDYDIYFKNKSAVSEIAKYYAKLWNDTHDKKVEIIEENERIQCFIRSSGAVIEEGENGIDDETEEESYVEETEEEKELQKFIVDTAKQSDKFSDKQENLQAPVVEEKQYTLKFTVKATKTKLAELKKFLKNGGYIYE